MDRPVRGVLLGAPGSGKGTQAARMSQRLGIPAISTGEMLREAVSAGSDLGQRVEQILHSGALVDDVTMAEVVKTRLAEDDAETGFLLDGYPRNRDQAETLAGILEELDENLDVVWFIDVPERELVRRALARQRADDKEEIIRKRLALYLEVTNPLVEHYRSMSLVAQVNGDQPIEDVTEAMMQALETRLAAGAEPHRESETVDA